MVIQKTTISARVELTLKSIVENSVFSHKDAYELGAKLIAIGDAEDTMSQIDRNPIFKEIIRRTEYRLLEARKVELEKELDDL